MRKYVKVGYLTKIRATVGEATGITADGKAIDLAYVNRDIGNVVDVVRDRRISPAEYDLGTEYWATGYGRERFRGDIAKAGNKVERVSEIIRAVIRNKDKDIGLYYRDRLDFEEERDRKERSGEAETLLIDREKALEIARRASEGEIDDLQIISTRDPNIREIIGAEGIAGRVYHVGNGKIVIVADNIGDYAKAIGTISEEGRHIYHRRENGLEDSEDYASFYGRQFERYYGRNFDSGTVAFVTERLRYTKGQLGSDWEDDAFEIGGRFSVTAWGVSPKIDGSIVVVRDPYKQKIDIYFRGSAGVEADTKFAASEAKLYINYYPGALSLYDTKVANMKYSNGVLDDGLKVILNSVGIGVNDASVYIRYYNTLAKDHHFTGIGIDAGYSFSFGLLDNLINKIKIGNSKLGTKLTHEIAKGFVEYLKKDASIEAGTYIKIASFKTPLANFLNPTDDWIKITERPKGK